MKKLRLSREVLAELDPEQLRDVAGGELTGTCIRTAVLLTCAGVGGDTGLTCGCTFRCIEPTAPHATSG